VAGQSASDGSGAISRVSDWDAIARRRTVTCRWRGDVRL